jgi:replicative DNA helicase
VEVSQFNRDISSPIRLKAGDVEPMLEDFKDTGSTQEDADVVLSLFDPMRYKVADPAGYDLNRLRNDEKHKMYRSLKILKNSYGGDDIRIGLAMQPVVGMFREMPRFDQMTDIVYDSIRDNTFFLNENE